MWLSDVSVVQADRVIERGAVLIAHGRIVAVQDGAAPQDGTAQWPLHGLMLIPGIIDMHGDMLEREIEPRPRAYLPYPLALHELDKRLAASGVTTAYAAVSFSEISVLRSTIRREDTGRAIVQAIHDERPTLLTDIRAHARFEVTNQNAATMLKSMLHDRLVDLVSLNDHTPGQGQYRNIEKYIKEMAAWRKISDVYAEEITRERISEIGKRPVAWEIIREVCQIAHAQGLPIASHDDDTPEKIALMREFGATISEFPVTLEAAQAAHAAGMHVVMGAPNALRGVSTGGNLSARDAIAAGVVALLAADYHPGALLQSAILLAREGVLAFHQAIALITCNVANAVRLYDRGEIAVGKRADLAIVDVTGAMPKVRGTLRGGEFIYADKHLNINIGSAEREQLPQ